jgi:hypothetical protein
MGSTMSEARGPFDADEEDVFEEDEDDGLGPGDADYDLSEAHGYNWEPARQHWPVQPWIMIAVSLLVVAALVVPTLLIALRDR